MRWTSSILVHIPKPKKNHHVVFQIDDPIGRVGVTACSRPRTHDRQMLTLFFLSCSMQELARSRFVTCNASGFTAPRQNLSHCYQVSCTFSRAIGGLAVHEIREIAKHSGSIRFYVLPISLGLRPVILHHITLTQIPDCSAGTHLTASRGGAREAPRQRGTPRVTGYRSNGCWIKSRAETYHGANIGRFQGRQIWIGQRALYRNEAEKSGSEPHEAC